jgi:uncharacterized protein YjbI with pentapeptide repeats
MSEQDIPITAADRVELRDACIRLFPDPDEIRLVLDDVGVPVRRRPDGGRRADDAWRVVFNDLDDGLVEAPYRKVLASAARQEGRDEVIGRLSRTYLPDRGDHAGTPAARGEDARTPAARGADASPAPVPSAARRYRVPVAAWSFLAALVFLAAVVLLVFVGRRGGSDDEPPTTDRGAPTDAAGGRAQLMRDERQLEDPSPGVRRLAVLDMVNLATTLGNLRSDVCSGLLHHITVRLAWNAESDRHQGINITNLEARSPDGASALQAVSTLQCWDISGKVSLKNLDLRAWTVEHAHLRGATINYSHLGNASLYDADLTDANLVWDVLQYARMPSAVLKGAQLQGVNFEESTLTRADLSGAKLGPSHGRATNLRGADLSMATLTGADLRGVNLHDAALTGAHLENADLSTADLSGADLRGAFADARTRWPAGFDPGPAGVHTS